VGYSLEKLIPQIKLKSALTKRMTVECSNFSVEYRPPHNVEHITCVFESEFGGDCKEVRIVEETVENTSDEFESRLSELLCHGSSLCCVHGISVNGEVVVEYSRKPVYDWSDYDDDYTGYGHKIGAHRRMR
jgi:hypothetical protein